MDRHIPEADWRRFRRLAPLALDRYCRRVLSELAELAAGASGGGHDRYLAAYRLIGERDAAMAAAFDAPSRSAAVAQLARMRSLGVVTDEEFSEFSGETRGRVDALLRQ